MVNAPPYVFYARIFANFSAFRVDFRVSRIPLNTVAASGLTIETLAAVKNAIYCNGLARTRR